MKKIILLLFLISTMFAFESFSQNNSKDYRSLRVGLNSGYSYQLRRTDSGLSDILKEYNNKLKSGFHISADIIHFPQEKWGVGAKTSFFNAQESLELNYGERTDNVTVVFVGGLASRRVLIGESGDAFLINASAGILRYIGIVSEAGYGETYTTNTAGVGLDLSYDINLNKHFQFGVQASVIVGYFSAVYKDGKEYFMKPNERINISRIEISLGLRFVK